MEGKEHKVYLLCPKKGYYSQDESYVGRTVRSLGDRFAVTGVSQKVVIPRLVSLLG